MTDKKMPLASEPARDTDKNAPSAAESIKNTGTKKPVTNKATAKTQPPKEAVKETVTSDRNKISKLAIFAIIIAIVITVVHYFWQQQQNQQLTLKLTEQVDSKNTATLSQYQTQMKNALIEQQQTFSKQLQQVKAQVNQSNQVKMTELSKTVSLLERKVKQRQPSEWLIHEAEYLIRIAARTLWLENDATAAISLLKNADARLADLNDPAFLPVRKLVHQDIKSLELMPVLHTDKIVLTLMAMNKQVAQLILPMVDVGTDTENTTDQELSNDINDWKANLAKTWNKFVNDFIRVRQRDGLIEPLISPKQQQHLKQNLNLKIQLAIWAATEHENEVYQKTLVDIQQWVTDFFELEEANNIHFLQSIAELQAQQVSYNYPSELSSLAAVRTVLKNQTALVALPNTKKPQDTPTKTVDESEKQPVEKQHETVKPKPKESAPLPTKQDIQPNVEEII
jgi:uroporphyrin-3 C-methyltransferase